MLSLALCALTAAQPGQPPPPPRIDDEDYLRPVELVRKWAKSKVRSTRCELKSLDAANLSAEAFAELAINNEQGLVLRNLPLEALARPNDWSRERLLQRFGDRLIATGTGRWDRPEATPERRLATFAQSANDTAKNLVAKGYTHQIVSETFWGPEGNCSEPVVAGWHCTDRAKIFPEILVDFDKRPTLQVAMSSASGTQLHSHEETWLALLHGRKAWWIAGEEPSRELLSEEQANTRHPCQWLEEGAPEGLTFCVQQPGEVIYFGLRLHATCNLDDYVLGIGAQGRLLDRSALELAVHRGQTALVQDLLQAKKKPPSTRQLQRWLGHALDYGFTSLVALLLDRKADLHRRLDDGKPPLHTAAENGHMETAKLLLERRADVRLKDVDSKEALHHAAYNDNGHVATLLLARRADLQAKDQRGLSAFASAADGGYPELMETLLQLHAPQSAQGFQNAAVHAASKGHLPVLKALAKWTDLARRDKQGRQLADHAEYYQHVSVAQWLRKHTASSPKGGKGSKKPSTEL
ncbi:unnamed protein product [Effrenium voratum]|nr:unnamed protein product [Effrenium voratum]